MHSKKFSGQGIGDLLTGYLVKTANNWLNLGAGAESDRQCKAALKLGTSMTLIGPLL
jgi:hypothetical protein